VNAFEQLQGQVAALAFRVRDLEALLAPRRQEAADAQEARTVAERIGLDGDMVEAGGWQQALGRVETRRALARALSAHGWTAPRIARVLGCSEKTAHRYLQGNNCFHFPATLKGQLTRQPEASD
jgi:hypothetical protein